MTPLFSYKILVVDDAPVVREALRLVLGNEPDMNVVGEAGDSVEALARANELSPDAVILDIELPECDGLAIAADLKRMPHPPAIIFLSVHLEGEYKQRALEAGGDDYVEKASGYATLIEKIRHALTQRKNKPPA